MADPNKPRYVPEFALAKQYPDVEPHPNATRLSVRLEEREKIRDQLLREKGAGQFKGSLKEAPVPDMFSSTQYQRQVRLKPDERKGNMTWNAMKSAWKGDSTAMYKKAGDTATRGRTTNIRPSSTMFVGDSNVSNNPARAHRTQHSARITEDNDDQENVLAPGYHPLTRSPSGSPATSSRRSTCGIEGGWTLIELSPNTRNGWLGRQTPQAAAREDEQTDTLQTGSNESAHHTYVPAVAGLMRANGLNLTFDNLNTMAGAHTLGSTPPASEHSEIFHNEMTDLIFHAYDMVEAVTRLVRATDYDFKDDDSSKTAMRLGFHNAYDVLQHCSSLVDRINCNFHNHPEYPNLHAIEIKMSNVLRGGRDLQAQDVYNRTDLPIPTKTIRMPATKMFDAVAWIKSQRQKCLNILARLEREPEHRQEIWRRIFFTAPHICRSKEFLIVLLLAPKIELLEVVRSRFRIGEDWYDRSVDNCLREYCEVAGLDLGRATVLFKGVKDKFH